ncbi:MAG: tautomerase family protein [Mogibacterium sp.]|nr:tautomerase family protein [Mogibacterium sp.]
MPHIQINLWPGRSEEKMKDFADKLVDFAAQELGTKRAAFTVGVREVNKEDWKDFFENEVNKDEIILDCTKGE